MNGTTLIYGGFPLFMLFLSNYSVSGDYWNQTNFFDDFKSRRNGRSIRTNRNNLLTFDTRDNDIEVAFEFSVPFISIPVKRSIDTMKNSLLPLANLNSGAVIFAGAMVLAGAMVSYLWRMAKSQTANLGLKNKSKDKKNDELGNNKIMKLMHLLEKSFEKYDIEPTICSQRLICTLSKASAEKVSNGIGTSSDKIIDGIFSSNWFLEKVAGTAVDDAIQASKFVNDCNTKYNGCNIKLMSVEEMFEIFIKIIKK